jgi:hypothetical protein
MTHAMTTSFPIIPTAKKLHHSDHGPSARSSRDLSVPRKDSSVLSLDACTSSVLMSSRLVRVEMFGA